MTKHGKYSPLIERTESGAIDFYFYDRRAHQLKAQQAWGMMRRLVKGKKFSCVAALEAPLPCEAGLS